MDKRDIEKLRLKTQMNEALHLVETSPYQSIRQNAELKLKFLQEQYKGAFGEYSKDHEIKVVEGTIKYAKMPIGDLIKELQKIEAKSPDGKTEIWVDGTLMTPDGGNYVIMTNKPQM